MTNKFARPCKRGIMRGSLGALPRMTRSEYRDQRPLSVDPLNIMPQIIPILPPLKREIVWSQN